MKKKVKTILLEDINKVGKKYDLKELSKGYAQYLYKEQKINFYTPETWSEVEKEKGLEKERQSAAIAQAQDLQKRLAQLTLAFTLPKNQKGGVLGSIGSPEILAELKKMDILLTKKHLPTDFHSLNKVGEHVVSLKLGGGLNSQLKITIN
jgi:ribosomal protein L9